MKLIILISTLLLVILTTPSLACKCILKKEGKPELKATRRACRNSGGRMVGDDCDAHSISEALNNFHFICETRACRSDCRCSVGCADVEGDDESVGEHAGEGKGDETELTAKVEEVQNV